MNPTHRQSATKVADRVAYWLGLPLRWAYQVVHNGHGIVRVLDITKWRPMQTGLIDAKHPWCTGINPQTGRTIWSDNVIFRTPRGPDAANFADDDIVLEATGKFLARRVRQSAVTEEIPIGPKRRMPHAINYIHGTSHYNSGIILFTDFREGYQHITDPAFRRELHRFVETEQREVLFLFRNRDYHPRDFAYFSCCMRAVFPWFCNPNGPRGNVLWGNAAPFPTANLITGCWMHDVYALKQPGGAERVVRPPIVPDAYFQQGPYNKGRTAAVWPEKLLAWATHWRVRVRGAKGGLFFVDRRENYADHIENRTTRGIADRPVVRM